MSGHGAGRRSARARGLRLLGSLLLLLVLAELAALVLLRVRDGAWPDLPALEARLAALAGGQVDDALGEVPLPNQRYLRSESLHPYVGFLPRFTPRRALDDGLLLNQDEFYGAGSPVFAPDDDTFVVGVAGGSVAGRFVREGGGAALAPQLQALPFVGGRTVRFAVLAFGGFKQPQALMALNYLLALGGRLDLLIELDGFNEIALHEQENQLQGVAPIYPRAWFFRVGVAEVVEPIQAQLAILRRQRGDLARKLLASPLRRSWVQRLLWSRADGALAAQLEASDAALRALLAEHDLLLRGPLSAADTPEQRLDELVGIWSRSSRQLDVLCRAHGIEYFHFLQPNQYVAGSKPFSAQELDEALSPDHTYGASVAEGYPRLQRAGAQLRADGLRFHDLTGVFADVDQTVYVDDCCHVNERGNLELATAIAAAIAAAH